MTEEELEALKNYREARKKSRIYFQDLENMTVFDIQIRNGLEVLNADEIDNNAKESDFEFVKALFSYSTVNKWFKNYFSKEFEVVKAQTDKCCFCLEATKILATYLAHKRKYQDLAKLENKNQEIVNEMEQLKEEKSALLNAIRVNLYHKEEYMFARAKINCDIRNLKSGQMLMQLDFGQHANVDSIFKNGSNSNVE